MIWQILLWGIYGFVVVCVAVQLYKTIRFAPRFYQTLKNYLLLSAEDQAKLAPRIKKAPKLEGHRLLIFILLLFVIGIVHFSAGYSYLRNVLAFRQLSLDHVVGLEVQKIPQEDPPEPQEPVVITDSVQIRDALRQLEHSKRYSRNHESFSNGYLIKLVFDEPNPQKTYYLAVYKQSSRQGPVAIVRPQVGGVGYNGLSLNAQYSAGTYSCPAFVSWITQQADPLLNKRQTISR